MILVMLYTYKALGGFQNLFSLTVDHLILVPILWSKQDIIPLSLEIDFKIILSGGSSLFGKLLYGATVHKSDTSGSVLVQLEDWRGGLALLSVSSSSSCGKPWGMFVELKQHLILNFDLIPNLVKQTSFVYLKISSS